MREIHLAWWIPFPIKMWIIYLGNWWHQDALEWGDKLVEGVWCFGHCSGHSRVSASAHLPLSHMSFPRSLGHRVAQCAEHAVQRLTLPLSWVLGWPETCHPFVLGLGTSSFCGISTSQFTQGKRSAANVQKKTISGLVESMFVVLESVYCNCFLAR